MWDFRNLLAFLIQSMANFYDTRRNDNVMNPQHLGAIWWTSGSESRLIQKFGFKFRITFGPDFGLGGGLRSLSTV